MAGLSADRPSEVVLAARVARQFYLEGVSKVDIADRLGISRFRVARLLESARDAGMVRIEIGLPGGTLDAGLSADNPAIYPSSPAELAAHLSAQISYLQLFLTLPSCPITVLVSSFERIPLK